MEHREPLTKRRRSDEGLLGLLGAYASDEEELEEAESPKRQKSSEGIGEITVVRTEAVLEGPLIDLTAAMASASQQLEKAQLEEASKSDTASLREPELEDLGVESHVEELADADPYWLPPEIAEPPSEPCDPKIQAKVTQYLSQQEQKGTTISNELRSHSGYRNPDFLQHCVVYDSISEYGTCYPPEVFDPTNLPPEDYYDRLAVEWQEYTEKQRAERSKTQKVDFTKGSSDSLSKSTGGLNAAAIAAQVVAQAKDKDKRSSKWDSKR